MAITTQCLWIAIEKVDGESRGKAIFIETLPGAYPETFDKLKETLCGPSFIPSNYDWTNGLAPWQYDAECGQWMCSIPIAYDSNLF